MTAAAAVTVVVPTRNRRPVLEQTLRSVLGQKDVDLEVVVVDEGSADDTPEYLATLCDPRLRVIRHDVPRGLSAARNAGVVAARTSWVAFCDDDDLWAPHKLRTQLDALGARPDARWSCTGNISVDPQLRLMGHHRAYLGDDIGTRMRVYNAVPGGGSSVVVERQLALDVGGFDESLEACEDFDMWCRLAARSPVAAVDEPLMAYRVWPGSMSSDPARMCHWHDIVVARHRGGLDPSLVRQSELIKEQYLLLKEQYRGWFLLEADRRWAAAWRFCRMAARFRSPTHLVQAAMAVAAPGMVLGRARRSQLAGIPTPWAAAADAWLEAFRSPRPVPA